MLKNFLEKFFGVLIGRPRTLSHKENSELRTKGIIKAQEVAWMSADKKHLFVRDNKTSLMRVIDL